MQKAQKNGGDNGDAHAEGSRESQADAVIQKANEKFGGGEEQRTERNNARDHAVIEAHVLHVHDSHVADALQDHTRQEDADEDAPEGKTADGTREGNSVPILAAPLCPLFGVLGERVQVTRLITKEKEQNNQRNEEDDRNQTVGVSVCTRDIGIDHAADDRNGDRAAEAV